MKEEIKMEDEVTEIKLTKKQQIIQLQNEITELNKKIKSEKDTSDRWYRDSQEKQKTINEFHALLDGLGDIPRHKEVEQAYGGCSKTELSIMARFAYFLNTLINK
jgi:predicted RNase H-like nuclease (RuvC/YqgF family)